METPLVPFWDEQDFLAWLDAVQAICGRLLCVNHAQVEELNDEELYAAFCAQRTPAAHVCDSIFPGVLGNNQCDVQAAVAENVVWGNRRTGNEEY